MKPDRYSDQANKILHKQRLSVEFNAAWLTEALRQSAIEALEEAAKIKCGRSDWDYKNAHCCMHYEHRIRVHADSIRREAKEEA